MRLTITQHPMTNGFTHTINLEGGNRKLIAEVRGERYATLMAAAPDMLDALMLFLNDWDKTEYLEELDSSKWLLAMSNAVRKAHGGNPAEQEKAGA